MNSIFVLCCLSLLLALAATQAPKHCVSPPLMSGGFSVMAGEGHWMSTGTISYDAFGQRMRVKNYAIANNQSTGMDQLMLFNQKIYYEINWRKFSCKKKPLDISFIPMHVPEDAELLGQVFMGSSSSWGMGVLINNWHGKLPNNGTYSTVFSEIGCIPMTYTAFTPASGWTTISTFNWVLGQVDPMEYIPPFLCAKAQLEETETPHTFFTALESLATQSKEKLV
ncbi:ependymin-like [Solea senegalensis]|uniref:Ependymin-like n=1 Tax=Solea senegalensis TaxID=28829 RepID=A0AAV6Q7W3_SOLSE|nr:ependymin-like [Solea senegalensis]KAG7485574.1 ependymin-like [Solea senegalensis]